MSEANVADVAGRVQALVAAAQRVDTILRLARSTGLLDRLCRSDIPKRVGDPAALVSALSRTQELFSECAPLVDGIRDRLVRANPGFSSPQLHAPTAHDAALVFARRVLGAVEILRTESVRRIEARGGDAPADPTREAKAILRQANRSDRLPELPPTDRIFAAIDREVTRARGRRTDAGGGGGAPTNPYAASRDFARTGLKGQERAVVEALCDAGGQLPIADLAVREGVSWDDPFAGFKGVQRRLNPKLKKLGWRLERRDNAAALVATG